MKKRKKKRSMVSFVALIIVIVFGLCCMKGSQTVEAKATNKAMKFLQGTWVTAGNSQAEKVIFTKEYMKVYSLWNEDYTRVYSSDHKGKFMYKVKIVSTKKKGDTWTIKVGKKGSYIYYKGKGDGLDCWWKENGEWQYSGSDSLVRITNTD